MVRSLLAEDRLVQLNILTQLGRQEISDVRAIVTISVRLNFMP